MKWDIFRKSRRSRGHVVQWVASQPTHEAAHWPPVDVLFWVLMASLTNYPDKEEAQLECTRASEAPDSGVRYFDDHGLFELACYAFFRLDSYLYVNHPAHRDAIADFILERVLGLFGEAIGRRHASRVFNNRVQGYGQIFRVGAQKDRDIEDHLSALMCIAKRGNVVVDYDFDESPMKNMGYDMFHYLQGSIAVTGWLAGFTPLLVKHVDECVRSIDYGNAARAVAAIVGNIASDIAAGYAAVFTSCNDIDALPGATRDLANRARTFEATQIATMYGLTTVMAFAELKMDAEHLRRFGDALLLNVATDMASRHERAMRDPGYDASIFRNRYLEMVRTAPNGFPTLAYTCDFILERTTIEPTDPGRPPKLPHPWPPENPPPGLT